MVGHQHYPAPMAVASHQNASVLRQRGSQTEQPIRTMFIQGETEYNSSIAHSTGNHSIRYWDTVLVLCKGRKGSHSHQYTRRKVMSSSYYYTSSGLVWCNTFTWKHLFTYWYTSILKPIFYNKEAKISWLQDFLQILSRAPDVTNLAKNLPTTKF